MVRILKEERHQDINEVQKRKQKGMKQENRIERYNFYEGLKQIEK